MDKFIIKGGNPLNGTVQISGAKNSALPCLAATLLSPKTITLHNVPYVKDLITQRRLLEDLGAEILPPGYQTVLSGQAEELGKTADAMVFVFVTGLLLVYMVLASLFESLLHPFTIMLTLPLAGVGVVFAFLIVGEPLSVMAYIGIIMLAGIAANDSIILVDYVNRLRANGTARRAALLQAGRDRLRRVVHDRPSA